MTLNRLTKIAIQSILLANLSSNQLFSHSLLIRLNFAFDAEFHFDPIDNLRHKNCTHIIRNLQTDRQRKAGKQTKTNAF